MIQSNYIFLWGLNTCKQLANLIWNESFTIQWYWGTAECFSILVIQFLWFLWGKVKPIGGRTRGTPLKVQLNITKYHRYVQSCCRILMLLICFIGPGKHLKKSEQEALLAIPFRLKLEKPWQIETETKVYVYEQRISDFCVSGPGNQGHTWSEFFSWSEQLNVPLRYTIHSPHLTSESIITRALMMNGVKLKVHKCNTQESVVTEFWSILTPQGCKTDDSNINV